MAAVVYAWHEVVILRPPVEAEVLTTGCVENIMLDLLGDLERAGSVVCMPF